MGEREERQSGRPHSCRSSPQAPQAWGRGSSLSEWRGAGSEAGLQDAAPRLEVKLKSVVGRTGPRTTELSQAGSADRSTRAGHLGPPRSPQAAPCWSPTVWGGFPGAWARGQASCQDGGLACGKGRAWLRAPHWVARVMCCLPAGPQALCSRQPPINTSRSACRAARAWGANRRQRTGPLASRARPLVGGPSQTQKQLDLETEYFCGDAPGGHGSPKGQERVREVASVVRALKGR